MRKGAKSHCACVVSRNVVDWKRDSPKQTNKKGRTQAHNTCLLLLLPTVKTSPEPKFSQSVPSNGQKERKINTVASHHFPLLVYNNDDDEKDSATFDTSFFCVCVLNVTLAPPTAALLAALLPREPWH